jgi:hypothetical protein
MLSTRLRAAFFLASGKFSHSSVGQRRSCGVSFSSCKGPGSGIVLERKKVNDCSPPVVSGMGVFTGGEDDTPCVPLSSFLGIGTVLDFTDANLRSQPALLDYRFLLSSSGSTELVEWDSDGGGPPELRKIFMGAVV